LTKKVSFCLSTASQNFFRPGTSGSHTKTTEYKYDYDSALYASEVAKETVKELIATIIVSYQTVFQYIFYIFPNVIFNIFLST